MVHFRAPPVRLQPLICLLPLRLTAGLLLPMDQSGFVTPLQQPSHDLPVRSSQHEGLHRGFRGPNGASPERLVSIPQQGRSDVAVRTFGLAERAEGVEEKRREVSP
jgi:hypothetical protein